MPVPKYGVHQQALAVHALLQQRKLIGSNLSNFAFELEKQFEVVRSVRRELWRAREQGDFTGYAFFFEQPGNDETIAAVVAFAGNHQHAALGNCAETLDDRLGDPAPARSISTKLGVPYFWIVNRSSSRISSAVNNQSCSNRSIAMLRSNRSNRETLGRNSETV